MLIKDLVFDLWKLDKVMDAAEDLNNKLELSMKRACSTLQLLEGAKANIVLY